MIKKERTDNILKEVCLLRLMLIILLVAYHSFAPYTGSWESLPNAGSLDTIYKLIGVVTYSFMLETFTFISGYIFGYQTIKRKTKTAIGGGNVLRIKEIVIKKARRLLIPSIIFSIIYLLIFNQAIFKIPSLALWKSIEGVGHMWYLPMLFWCFVAIYFIEASNLKIGVAVISLVFMATISFIDLPLQISQTMY